jgi:hypothetical protein
MRLDVPRQSAHPIVNLLGIPFARQPRCSLDRAPPGTSQTRCWQTGVIRFTALVASTTDWRRRATS